MMFETAAVMSVAEISSGRKIFSACEFLLEELSKKAYRVEKISVVIENVGVIAHELEFLTKQFDIVAIIGRLNSNFILQGIAKICDEQLVSRHTSFSGIELLPPAAKCLACNASTLPLVYLQRVFILDVDHIEALTSCLLRHIEQYRSKPKFKKTFSTQKILNGILNSLEVGRGVTLTRHEKRDTIVLENNDFHIFVECERILRKELGDNVNDICDNSDVLEIIYKSNDGYIQRALEFRKACAVTMIFNSAAVLFIGPISNGKTIFGACEFLLNQLGKIEYKVERINVVTEDAAVVAHELETLTRQLDIVIVIGSLKSYAVLDGLAQVCGEELETRNSKVSLLPPAAKFLSVNASTFPLVYLKRIFILDREHVETTVTNVLLKHIEQYRSKPLFKKVFSMKRTFERPEANEDDAQKGDTITLEHNSFDVFVESERILRKELSDDISEICDSNDMLELIYRSNEEHVQKTVEHIRNCLKTYDPENIFLCFNGGKDCTVLLHLIYTVLKFDYPAYKDPLFCMYVRSSEVFPEQEKFISQCQIYYNLDVMSVSLGIKESLEKVLELKPNLKACFMGTRSTDPFSQDLTVFQVTDPSWPQVMRVSPLLEWHYSDIWDYLLFYKVPYCSLYDKGYTSLGSAANTVRNPCLSFFDVRLGKETYLPAYKLFNEAEERNGRNVLQ